MNEQRFACTACGLCCYGLLPLTIDEALHRADRFPLAIAITPVRPGTRGHTSMAQIGITAKLGKAKPLSLLVTPISFIPPALPCPELSGDNLCSIHDDKPERCKTMPFYAYKDEDSQRDLLIPRAGWKCDTGQSAPVVYKDGKIIDRSDFASEKAALVKQVASLQRFVDLLVKYDPSFSTRLQKGIHLQKGGKIIVSFLSYLRQSKEIDLAAFASRQHPVLSDWAQKTAEDKTTSQFRSYYLEAMAELLRYMD